MKYAVVSMTAKGPGLPEIAKYAAAQQRQLREDYATLYDQGEADEVRATGIVIMPGVRDTAASLTAKIGASVRDDESPIVLWDDVPKGGPDDALGVHDRLPDGRPICHVYLALAKESGDTWTSIASHEALEARRDPGLHLCIELDDGSIWDVEICDRVEADWYLIDGVVLSNFNGPACFEPASKPGEVYDHLRLSKLPNEVRPGGYAQRFDPQAGWTQVGTMRDYRRALAAHGLTRASKRKRRKGDGRYNYKIV